MPATFPPASPVPVADAADAAALADILAKLSADPATETRVAEVAARLADVITALDPVARESTLEDIGAKLGVQFGDDVLSVLRAVASNTGSEAVGVEAVRALLAAGIAADVIDRSGRHLGIVDSVLASALPTGAAKDSTLTDGSQRVGGTVTVDTELPAAAVPNDGDTNTGVPGVGARGRLWNGSGWDHARGNVEGTALASAARTGTTNSPDITNHNCRGVMVWLNVSNASGAGGLHLRIQLKDPISGNYITANTSPAAVITTGTFHYQAYPAAISTNSQIVQIAGFALPRTFRFQVIHDDSSSYTYSVGYSLLA